jgi:hypothetical protein
LRLDHYFKVRTLQAQRRGYTVSNVARKRNRGTDKATSKSVSPY